MRGRVPSAGANDVRTTAAVLSILARALMIVPLPRYCQILAHVYPYVCIHTRIPIKPLKICIHTARIPILARALKMCIHTARIPVLARALKMCIHTARIPILARALKMCIHTARMRKLARALKMCIHP